MIFNVLLCFLLLLPIGGALRAQEILHATPPRVLHKVEPEYSQEALDAKLEGTVVLAASIGVDGIPSDIKPVRTLGKGLDEKAVECLRRWQFSPATNHGQPIRVSVTIEVQFRLPRDRPASALPVLRFQPRAALTFPLPLV